jgi:hypothetical protein
MTAAERGSLVMLTARRGKTKDVTNVVIEGPHELWVRSATTTADVHGVSEYICSNLAISVSRSEHIASRMR